MNTETLMTHSGFLRALARSLLLSDDRADDVVQQTWVAAIERPPRDTRSLRSWLGKVTVNFAKKSMREESRRTLREQAVARDGVVLSAQDVVSREASVRRMVDAVFSLSEPYRSTILMRYYDDATPTLIARREGIALETVRTRLKRGLQLLRKELGAKEADEGSAWQAAIIPLAGLSGNASQNAWGTGALAQGLTPVFAAMKTVMPLAFLIGSMFFFFSWILSPTDPEPKTNPSGTAGSASPDPLPVAAAPAILIQGSLPEAEEPDPGPTSIVGGLELTVRWAEREAAPGINARITPLSENQRIPVPILETISGSTNDQGKFGITDLSPGRYNILLDRGISTWITVSAGRTTETTLILPPGKDIEGTVIDPTGTPIPSASIWVTFPHGQPGSASSAVSDENGKYFVRALNPQSYVGARATGFGPSFLHEIPRDEGPTHRTLELRDERGSIAGNVVSVDGLPLGGSGIIAIKRPILNRLRNQSGKVYAEPELFRTRANDQGEFELSGIPPGEWSVEIGASGFAPRKEIVLVEDGRISIASCALLPGAFVSGRVTDENGNPLPHIRIDARTEEKFLSEHNRSLAAYTNETGIFHLGPIPPEHVTLTAYSRAHGQAREVVSLESGQNYHWDTRLDPGQAIQGRVVDANDHDLEGWIVEIFTIKKGFRTSRGKTRTDSDGTFSFANCKEPLYRLEIFEPRGRGNETHVSALSLDSVEPGLPRTTIMVPDANRATAHVRGTLQSEKGRPLLPVSLQLVPTSFHYINCNISEPGPFVLGPFRPGTYRLRAISTSHGSMDLGEHILRHNESVDLGEILFKATGSLRLNLKREDGNPIDHRQFNILDEGFHRVTGIESDRQAARSSRPLAPGRYYLSPGDGLVDQTLIPFQIRTDQETTLNVLLTPAPMRRVEVRLAPEEAFPLRLTTRIRNLQGQIVWAKNIRFQGSSPGSHSFYLADGLYSLALQTDRGQKAELHFEIVAEEASQKPFILELR